MKTDKNVFAFVLMPFDKKFQDVYKLGIKQTALELGIKAERVDEQIYAEGILERIYRQIDAADIIVADMSGQNPNVFYEVGYAHAKNKLCVLITNRSEDIPFDLKHKRHVVYDSVSALKPELKLNLEWAKVQIENERKSRIRVDLHNVIATLTVNKYSALAEMQFQFDFTSELESPHEIEAIYVYSGSTWTLEQDAKKCPSTKSDLPRFTRRHFLVPPIKRMPKNGWARLEFTSRGILASAVRGQELKTSYKVVGVGVVRLATTNGDFDYEFRIDEEASEVDDIPF
jgi:nucleoside 2-deoxyribosyltransferase